ncbi:hypothetical protein AAHB56_10575, partial [Bacillus thuringiensis]
YFRKSGRCLATKGTNQVTCFAFIVLKRFSRFSCARFNGVVDFENTRANTNSDYKNMIIIVGYA